ALGGAQSVVHLLPRAGVDGRVAGGRVVDGAAGHGVAFAVGDEPVASFGGEVVTGVVAGVGEDGADRQIVSSGALGQCRGSGGRGVHGGNELLHVVGVLGDAGVQDETVV